jgi:hypothetical protein
LLERRPWKQRQAEIDGGGIKRVDGVCEIDAEAVVRVQAPGGGDQGLGEVGVDAPVASLVGVGQCVARHLAADAHVIELGLLGAQADFDVAQTFTIGELCERHAQILVEAREALDLVMTAISLDAAAKLDKRQMIGHLGENHLAGIHQPFLSAPSRNND